MSILVLWKLCQRESYIILQTPSIEVIELLTKRSLNIFFFYPRRPAAVVDFNFIISNFISHQINELSETRKQKKKAPSCGTSVVRYQSQSQSYLELFNDQLNMKQT